MTDFIPRHCLPAPFREEVFTVWRKGIYDDENTIVYINGSRDFAALCPRPVVDYDTYVPRLAKTGLGSYTAKIPMYNQRLAKVFPFLRDGGRLLEIGAGDGAFLRILRERFPAIRLASCEKDVTTKTLRESVVGKEDYADVDELVREGLTFDIACLFHVLEHIYEPAEFLNSLKKLAPKGRLIIEIPTLTDPLLSLYNCAAYEKFYFQRQHPFVYSKTSLCRLLEYSGFITEEIVPFQRYGLSNHLQWLTQGKPGGSPVYNHIFSSAQQHYIAALEHAGLTDSVIWVGRSGA